jgi:hypothetical protein
VGGRREPKEGHRPRVSFAYWPDAPALTEEQRRAVADAAAGVRGAEARREAAWRFVAGAERQVALSQAKEEAQGPTPGVPKARDALARVAAAAGEGRAAAARAHLAALDELALCALRVGFDKLACNAYGDGRRRDAEAVEAVRKGLPEWVGSVEDLKLLAAAAERAKEDTRERNPDVLETRRLLTELAAAAKEGREADARGYLAHLGEARTWLDAGFAPCNGPIPRRRGLASRWPVDGRLGVYVAELPPLAAAAERALTLDELRPPRGRPAKDSRARLVQALAESWRVCGLGPASASPGSRFYRAVALVLEAAAAPGDTPPRDLRDLIRAVLGARR